MKELKAAASVAVVKHTVKIAQCHDYTAAAYQCTNVVEYNPKFLAIFQEHCFLFTLSCHTILLTYLLTY